MSSPVDTTLKVLGTLFVVFVVAPIVLVASFFGAAALFKDRSVAWEVILPIALFVFIVGVIAYYAVKPDEKPGSSSAPPSAR